MPGQRQAAQPVALEDVTKRTLYSLRFGDAPDGVELVTVDVVWTKANGGGWREARHAGLFVGAESPDAPGPFGCHHTDPLAAIDEELPGQRAQAERAAKKVAKLERLRAELARGSA